MPNSRIAGRTAALRPILFLDFEASSLTPGSWPVEIGYAWIADGRVETRAMLIAPRADWSMDDWSEQSARIHGIPMAQILAGADADAVAAETDAFQHYDVVSDNPAWDQRWLDRLRADRAPIRLLGLREAVRMRLDDQAAGAVAQALFRSHAPHRAGPDAARMAEAWLSATRAYGLAA
jgi:hypothetical protein